MEKIPNDKVLAKNLASKLKLLKKAFDDVENVLADHSNRNETVHIYNVLASSYANIYSDIELPLLKNFPI